MFNGSEWKSGVFYWIFLFFNADSARMRLTSPTLCCTLCLWLRVVREDARASHCNCEITHVIISFYVAGAVLATREPVNLPAVKAGSLKWVYFLPCLSLFSQF